MYQTLTQQMNQSLGDFLTKSRLVKEVNELKSLIDAKTEELIRIQEGSDMMMNDRDLCKRFPFLTRSNLQYLRWRGTGPRYYKLNDCHNGKVVYKISDVLLWIKKCKVETTGT